MKTKRILIASIMVILTAIFAGYILPSVILKPQLSLKGKKEVTIDVLSSYEDDGATAAIANKDISDQIQLINNVDTSKIGSYKVEYIVKYKDKVYSISRKVNIIDRQAPVIRLEGDNEITLSSMDFYKEPGYSSKDSYEGDLTDSVTVKNTIDTDTCTITYSSTDSSGNCSEEKRVIHIKDIIPPVIKLKGNSYVTILIGSKYTDYGATAVDDLDGDISSHITVSGTVDTSAEGEYPITYNICDSSGNSSSVTRHVTVKSPDSVEVSPKSIIYLTFDDGPSANITPQVLDTLKRNDIKATFFIVNFTDANAALVKRAIAEGHTIGIHAYSHDYAKIYSSDSAYMDSISALKKKIVECTGYEPFCIRFPGGSSNAVSKKYSQGIMTRLSKEVTQAGYAYYDWNVSSGDAAANGASRDAIVRNVTTALRKNRSNVVLMHDAGAKQTTADALQEIIDYGKANGYTFAPVSKDTKPVHHNIAN